MFTLTIETGNAAFEDAPGPEIFRVIENLPMIYADSGEMSGKCMDINGNTVGTWSYTPSEGN